MRYYVSINHTRRLWLKATVQGPAITQKHAAATAWRSAQEAQAYMDRCRIDGKVIDEEEAQIREIMEEL